jgi:hypothetical protein
VPAGKARWGLPVVTKAHYDSISGLNRSAFDQASETFSNRSHSSLCPFRATNITMRHHWSTPVHCSSHSAGYARLLPVSGAAANPPGLLFPVCRKRGCWLALHKLPVGMCLLVSRLQPREDMPCRCIDVALQAVNGATSQVVVLLVIASRSQKSPVTLPMLLRLHHKQYLGSKLGIEIMNSF